MNLRDWFHELRQIGVRARFREAVTHRPPRLRGRFGGGEIADAFLAAQVEYLCHKAGVRPPKWVSAPEYVLEEPWFGSTVRSANMHALLIRDAPAEFVNRNIFTTSEIEWRPKRGRPRKTYAEKRETDRLRLRRWRASVG
jgi:hypothetical protein